MYKDIRLERLSSDEQSIMKSLKKGVPYIVIPFAWIFACVFVDMLTGTSGSMKSLVLRVVDAGFIISSIWFVITGVLLNRTGKKIYGEITADMPDTALINRLALKISRYYVFLAVGVGIVIMMRFALPHRITGTYFTARTHLPEISYLFTGIRRISFNGKITDIAEKYINA